MDSNPICHPSPAKRMKCLFLDYLQLLMIGRAGPWTRTPAATPLQPIKWNAHFWITFNFWCSAGLVDGFEPHLPPLCSQKHEMLIFGLHSTSNDRPGWSMDSNSICHPLQQKNEMLVFGLPSTSDDRSGWSMELNPIYHLSPAKKWNAHFWITFNFWWLAGLVDGLEPCVPPLCSQKNEMPIFRLHSTSDDWPGWSKDSNLICHPSPAKNMKCLFLDYIQLLMIGQAGRWTRTPSTTSLQPKNEMLIFGLRSTSDDKLDWSMDSNAIHHPSPAKNMKCLFLDYIQLLVIGQAGRCTQTPFATSLQPKNWNAHFWITFNFWWSAGLVDGIEPHLPPLSSQKKWNAHFWITFKFWW